jgi:hypothetical protein
MSLSDFNNDKKKECRRKYRLPYYLEHLQWSFIGSTLRDIFAEREMEKKKGRKAIVKLIRGKPEIELIENRHLGNYRYFVCPAGIIPVEKIPEGWGLYYYKNGKFYKKRESGYFRSNLRKENGLIVHALRRYASGDTTRMLINTYEFDPRRKIKL